MSTSHSTIVPALPAQNPFADPFRSFTSTSAPALQSSATLADVFSCVPGGHTAGAGCAAPPPGPELTPGFGVGAPPQPRPMIKIATAVARTLLIIRRVRDLRRCRWGRSQRRMRCRTAAAALFEYTATIAAHSARTGCGSAGGARGRPGPRARRRGEFGRDQRSRARQRRQRPWQFGYDQPPGRDKRATKLDASAPPRSRVGHGAASAVRNAATVGSIRSRTAMRSGSASRTRKSRKRSVHPATAAASSRIT